MSPDDLLPLCRDSLVCYAVAMWDGYRPADHHRLIADHLERVERGEIKRLMIQMPPRHGKSMLASEFFPSWFLSKNSDKQVIHATYNQELSDGFGRKVRNLMKEWGHQAIFPGVGVADDSSAASRFHTTSGGVYHGVGIGGGATGKGADLLLIDDPVKDRADAESETMRQRAKDWYKSVAYTRLMPGGAIVIIQTRWHEDDLSGWILEEHSHEDWVVLKLPAINSDGVALWPESYPVERLLQIEKTIGPRDFQALYQQEPRPTGGGEFKRDWIEYFTSVRHESMNKVILVDPASGKRKSNDFTSMWVIGLGADDNYYVLDIIRDRLNLTERSETLFRLHRKWKPSEVRYERYGMMADIEHIKSEMDRRSYRFGIREVGGATKKEDRIRRLVPLFQGRRFWFPYSFEYVDSSGERSDLVSDFIEKEFLSFPVSRHDDMLDALARIAEPDLDLPWPKQEKEVFSFVAPSVLDPIMGF